MQNYLFTITLAGYGNTPQEAWDDACTNFNMDWGDAPEEYTVKEEGE
jgi:hypothetical protein